MDHFRTGLGGACNSSHQSCSRNSVFRWPNIVTLTCILNFCRLAVEIEGKGSPWVFRYQQFCSALGSSYTHTEPPVANLVRCLSYLVRRESMRVRNDLNPSFWWFWVEVSQIQGCHQFLSTQFFKSPELSDLKNWVLRNCAYGSVALHRPPIRD